MTLSQVLRKSVWFLFHHNFQAKALMFRNMAIEKLFKTSDPGQTPVVRKTKAPELLENEETGGFGS